MRVWSVLALLAALLFHSKSKSRRRSRKNHHRHPEVTNVFEGVFEGDDYLRKRRKR